MNVKSLCYRIFSDDGLRSPSSSPNPEKLFAEVACVPVQLPRRGVELSLAFTGSQSSDVGPMFFAVSDEAAPVQGSIISGSCLAVAALLIQQLCQAQRAPKLSNVRALEVGAGRGVIG